MICTDVPIDVQVCNISAPLTALFLLEGNSYKWKLDVVNKQEVVFLMWHYVDDLVYV